MKKNDKNVGLGSEVKVYLWIKTYSVWLNILHIQSKILLCAKLYFSEKSKLIHMILAKIKGDCRS